MAACPRCGNRNPPEAKFCSECGLVLGGNGEATGQPKRGGDRSRRKVVTIVFSDLVGSTAMGERVDPETVRSVMSRYFGRMRTVLERHGGTVEKFIGDAIMAVFGLVQVHEDDALRAVRAASEMREALDQLNEDLRADLDLTIATRTGINTGEVVAGDVASGQPLVTGDTVNTAARLEQAAPAGEILLGPTTWHLVRHAATAEAVDPIAAKGKAEPLAAVRLVSVAAERPTVSPFAPRTRLVGRKRELRRLKDAFDRVVESSQPMLVTVLGEAGVGKSRLVAELTGGVAPNATVLRGRCLPYGDGITYWPLRQILHLAAGISEADATPEAVARLRALTADLNEGGVIAARLASAIGLSPNSASTDEILWAARRTFEGLAGVRPLVLVFEDIHWAEPTMLELIEHVAEVAVSAPILIVCLARRDLLDAAPMWGASAPHRLTISLKGLPAKVSESLADSIAGDASIDADLRARIVATAEGNPLFVEEMVRMAMEGGPSASRVGGRGASVQVPPTIQAVMAARIDQLPEAERSVAQRGAVVGRVFEEPAVASMSGESSPDEVRRCLGALVRKEFVAPERSELSLADAYKFRHILIRDAAYDGLPKAERAGLHEEFAMWLEKAAGERINEYQEIVAHHLLEAYRYRNELRETSDRTASLAERAMAHLASAGKQARDRGDTRAVCELLARAVDLPASDPELLAEIRLIFGNALVGLDRMAEAREQAELALQYGELSGDRRIAARARLLRLDVLTLDGSLVDSDPTAAAEAARAFEDADASGDPLARALAWRTLGIQAYMDGRSSEAVAAVNTSLDYVRVTGDPLALVEQEVDLLMMGVVGPMRTESVIELAESILKDAASFPVARAEVLRLIAIPEAMMGRADDARMHTEQALATYLDLGVFAPLVNLRADKAWVHSLAGDVVQAEADFRQAYADAKRIGDRTAKSWTAGRLAQFLKDEGRMEEARPLLDEADQVPIVMNRTRVLGGRVRLMAAAGDSEARTELARLVEMLGDVSRSPNIATDGFVDAAESSYLLGDYSEAERYGREALRISREKGNVARAAQIESIIARVREPAHTPG